MVEMKEERYWWEYETDLGKVFIGADRRAIIRVSLVEIVGQGWLRRRTLLLDKANRQLGEYLAGERKKFDLPLRLEGTVWQRRVWAVLQTIPYGERWSYKMVAERVGNGRAARAVGGANNKNPIPILVACHRVVGAGGGLVGYSWGLEIKKKLLGLEKIWQKKGE
jgi:methylated-DNA-[protein]-cysteine S-methyltransferase